MARPTRLNVLFADDDQVLAQIVDAALKKAGCNVTIARDAMQAVMFAVRTPPDVIVLDISMPGGNGLMALQKLKASDKTRHIPVLVVSGLTDATLPEKVRELGAMEFQAKPIDVEALPQRLRGLIDQDRITRERVLDAISRLGRPAGADLAAIRNVLATEHKSQHEPAALEAILEHLRSQRKVVKQQSRWFLA